MSPFDHTARCNLLPETRAFLREWMAWVERGAPHGDPFSRGSGLCPIAEKRADYITFFNLGIAFGEARYPFGRNDYWTRAQSQTAHECPKRLAWVRANMEDDA